MARNKFQLEVRKYRVELANNILAWMKEKGISGGKLTLPTLDQFARDKHIKLFAGWQAWDLLREAGRLCRWSGAGWKVLDYTPIAADENGDLIEDTHRES